MKKLVLAVAFGLVLVLTVVGVVYADPPPDVAPAVHEDEVGGCFITTGGSDPIILYAGTYDLKDSNGATGHRQLKCKLDLVPGQTPRFQYWEVSEFPWPRCYTTFSLEGDKGMWISQCWGYWA